MFAFTLCASFRGSNFVGVGLSVLAFGSEWRLHVTSKFNQAAHLVVVPWSRSSGGIAGTMHLGSACVLLGAAHTGCCALVL